MPLRGEGLGVRGLLRGKVEFRESKVEPRKPHQISRSELRPSIVKQLASIVLAMQRLTVVLDRLAVR